MLPKNLRSLETTYRFPLVAKEGKRRATPRLQRGVCGPEFVTLFAQNIAKSLSNPFPIYF